MPPLVDINTVAKPSEAHVGEMAGRIRNPWSQFIRPSDTTQYAANELVGSVPFAPFIFNAVRVIGGNAMIRTAKLKKSTTVTTLAQFRLHLYASYPMGANVDNAAWSTAEANYLGSFALDMTSANARTFTDGISVMGTPDVGSDINLSLAETGGTTIIYGALQVLAAYTPGASEIFTATLYVLQN